MKIFSFILIFICGALLSSCEDNKGVIAYEPYTGPLRILTNAVIEHSDSAIVRGRLITPQLYDFSSGDRELPKGGYLEFYDLNGQITATLRSDYGYYTIEDETWRIEGNVILKNAESGETLHTEQLYWNPKDGKVFTDKFVRIENGDEILTGIGLTANQDFSSYVIKEPQGTFILEEL